MPPSRWLSALVCVVTFTGINSLAEAEPAAKLKLISPLEGATFSPALKAAADRDQVVLFVVEDETPEPAEGDAIVYWVGTKRGTTIQQWLIRLQRRTATADELASHRGKDVTKYLSSGSKVVFHSDLEPLDLWIAGPVDTSPGLSAADGAPAPVHRTRVFVPRDYLRLGLDKSNDVHVVIQTRTAAIRKEDPKFRARIYALDSPIQPESIAAAKPGIERVGLTPEMERTWIGGYVALQSFFEVANDIAELRGIAEVAVQKPSVFKLAKLATGTKFMTSFGSETTKRIDPRKLGLLPVDSACFEAPFAFAFGQDAIVQGSMIVTPAVPPRDVGAGIIGLIAVNPEDVTRVVQMAAVSATHGSKPTASSPATK